MPFSLLTQTPGLSSTIHTYTTIISTLEGRTKRDAVQTTTLTLPLPRHSHHRGNPLSWLPPYHGSRHAIDPSLYRSLLQCVCVCHLNGLADFQRFSWKNESGPRTSIASLVSTLTSPRKKLCLFTALHRVTPSLQKLSPPRGWSCFGPDKMRDQRVHG